MNQDIENLAQLSDTLTNASFSICGELLAKRRAILDALATHRQPPYQSEKLATALRSGSKVRSRLLVQLGALRAKIDDLRRLRADLGQLRPTGTPPPSLDVRL